ncbi:endonuclease III domain-containing protein [Thermopirellula anaerolimosa]
MSAPLMEVYRRLFEHFGPQHWWPAETPFEVLVGAVLVQNTAWSNVEKVMAILREEGIRDVAALDRLAEEELHELIRPVGYYRIKGRRLKNLLSYVLRRHGGSLDAMFQTPRDQLRRELLEINGIGPETADSILLYAGNLPTFVVDAYTLRIFARHRWVEPDADYHELKSLFEDGLESDAALYNEYHALLVRAGKDYCNKRRPKCQGCPLEGLLPEGGPADPADWA